MSEDKITVYAYALSSIKSRRPLSPSVKSTKTRKRKRHGTRSKPVHAPGGSCTHGAEQNRLLTNKVRERGVAGEGESSTIRLTRGEIITFLINDARTETRIINYQCPLRNVLSVHLLISKTRDIVRHIVYHTKK